MAEHSVAVRLSVIDGAKAKAELAGVGETGSRSLKRIEDAARPASRALQSLDGVAGGLRGSLEGMAGRLGPLGDGLMRIGPIGLAAAAALAGVGLVLKASVSETAEADRSYRRLEAVLKATGHASGLTASEIGAFAEAMESSTLVTAEAVQDAASVLATFRSVSGPTFTRAISLAQDLATVFGSDLSSAATQLGKALEDPVQGLTALRRVGVSFTDSEKDVIASLAETGRTAEAQRLILDALEKQVGGAGAAEAGGLTGAANRLSDAWGNLLKAIGRTPAIASVAQGALNLLSSAIEGITGALGGDPIGAQIDAAKARLLRAKEDLARLDAGGVGTPMLGQRPALDEQRQRVAALEAEVAKLEQVAKAEGDAEAAAKARAEAGRKAAEAERLREALTGQRRDLDKALDQLASTPSERIALVNRELAETKKRLDALRASDGSNAGDVDAALAKAEEVARRKIAQINQPAADEAKRAREQAERKAAAEQAAAERVYKANTKVIDDLARQLATFGDERQQFVDQALGRLSEGAGEAQIQQVKQLANALYDEKLAREAAIKAEQKQQALNDEGLRIKASLLTADEYVIEAERELNALLNANAIDQETLDRAMVEARKRAAEVSRQQLQESREFSDGLRRGVADWISDATDAAAIAESSFQRAAEGMTDALTEFVMTGKANFADFAKALIADINRMMIRMALALAMQRAIGYFGGGAKGGTTSGGSGQSNLMSGVGADTLVAHTGGIIGTDSLQARRLPMAAFAAAPRLHGGLMPGEYPAILQRGEGVFTPAQMRAMAQPIHVTVNNNSRASVDVQQTAGGLQIDIADLIDRTAAGLVQTPGSRLNRAVHR